MVKPTFQITIVADSQSEKCDSLCGADWTSAEAIDTEMEVKR
ncbi:hypothetical protein ACFLU8_00645 [Chloroflexota bacterium]